MKSDAFKTMKSFNPNEFFSHLMSSDTTTMYTVMVCLARYDLLTDRNFHEILDEITEANENPKV